MKSVIESFVPQGGKHCITNALKQVLTYYGYPLSEEMIFGLASGLSFLYLNQAHSPMVNGRTKVFDFEKKLAQRLQINIQCKSVNDDSKVMQMTKVMLDKRHPVLVYVDMPYLNYLGMDKQNHFGGHAVVLFGYDDAIEKFWVSDRDNHDYPIRVPSGVIHLDYHLVDYQEITRARSSTHRPFPARNKYLRFDFAGYKPISKQILVEAIKETCDTMLNPPAQLLGMNGIQKFAKEILKWKDFTPIKLQTACITNYFQIHADGGTGGGIFRKMYGDFLIEASLLLLNPRLKEVGMHFIDVAKLWDCLALHLWELSSSKDVLQLPQLALEIRNIYNIEKQLYLQLQEIIKTLE